MDTDTGTDRLRQWGTNVRTAREVRGFPSQQSFADALGVSQQTVSKWEEGRSSPRDDMKVRIAAELDLPVVALFPLDPPPAAS